MSSVLFLGFGKGTVSWVFSNKSTLCCFMAIRYFITTSISVNSLFEHGKNNPQHLYSLTFNIIEIKLAIKITAANTATMINGN